MREKETPAKSRPKDHILRRLYAELRFSGESLRINGRAMVFALAVGVVVGLCGGSFVYLEVSCWARRSCCATTVLGHRCCCPWRGWWWCGFTAGAASKPPGGRT